MFALYAPRAKSPPPPPHLSREENRTIVQPRRGGVFRLRVHTQERGRELWREVSVSYGGPRSVVCMKNR